MFLFFCFFVNPTVVGSVALVSVPNPDPCPRLAQIFNTKKRNESNTEITFHSTIVASLINHEQKRDIQQNTHVS